MEFLFILFGIYAVSLLAAWLGARLAKATGGGRQPPAPEPVRAPPVAESRYAVKSIPSHRHTPQPDPHPPSFHPRLLRPACIDNVADTSLVTPAYLRHSEREHAKSAHFFNTPDTRPERNDNGPESLPGWMLGVAIETSGEALGTVRDTEPAPPESARDTVVDFEPGGGSFGGAGAEGSWGSNDD